MCTERQHDSENVKLRHENMNLKAQLEIAKKHIRQQMDANGDLLRKNKELAQKVECLESMIDQGVA